MDDYQLSVGDSLDLVRQPAGVLSIPYSLRVLVGKRLNKEFVAFLAEYCPRVMRPSETTRDIVDDYQHYVRELTSTTGRPLANATVRLKLTAAKRFYAHRPHAVKKPWTC